MLCANSVFKLSLALGEPVGFATLQLALDINHVVAANGGCVARAGKLKMEDFLGAGAKHHFSANQIKFPHTSEAFVIHGLDFCAMFLEASVPVLQRHGIVQPKELTVSHPKSIAFHCGQHFRESG